MTQNGAFAKISQAALHHRVLADGTDPVFMPKS